MQLQEEITNLPLQCVLPLVRSVFKESNFKISV